MKITIFIIILFLFKNSIFGQINMTDSTVQVIGYWDMNEKQSYSITQNKFKITNSDTSSKTRIKYLVEVTIVDSSSDSYTIDWFYHDYDIQSDNELVNKIASIAEDMTVKIKTNELGVLVEVVNWEDIKKLIYKATSVLKDELKEIPNMANLINQIESMYNSKESIEAAAIAEIRQFYTYHGGKYKLGEEIKNNSKAANLYGGEPFDTEITLWLDEINIDDNNSIVRMIQSINSEQLTKTTFDYLTNMAETLGKPKPKWTDLPPLKNETRTASRIHGYGWLIYSIETKEVSANDVVNVEESIIELQ